MLQVLADAKLAKFEAAIAAVRPRGARPRKEDRRTIEAINWRLDNGAKWRWILAELDTGRPGARREGVSRGGAGDGRHPSGAIM